MASATTDPPRLPSPPHGIIAPWPVPNYTAWWHRHMSVNNLPKVVTWKRNGRDSNPPPSESQVQRSNHCATDMELGHWVTGSMGHLGQSGSPGHHFDPVWDPSFFPVFEKMPKMQNVHLKCWNDKSHCQVSCWTEITGCQSMQWTYDY